MIFTEIYFVVWWQLSGEKKSEAVYLLIFDTLVSSFYGHSPEVISISESHMEHATSSCFHASPLGIMHCKSSVWLVFSWLTTCRWCWNFTKMLQVVLWSNWLLHH